MELKVIDRDDDITEVALVGSLDVAGMHEVDVKFHGHTAAVRKSTIVDCRELDFIATLGMGMLIGCARSLQRHGAKMVLLGPQSLVEKALTTAGIDQVIPIAATREQAEAAVKS